jgi:hypothetical protein
MKIIIFKLSSIIQHIDTDKNVIKIIQIIHYT